MGRGLPGRRALVLGALLLGYCGGIAAATGAGARLQAFLDRITRLEARFTQTVLDDRFQVSERSSGRLYLSRPGRFRWEYTDPAGQLIVGDGKRVWVYDRDLEQVTVRPMNAVLGSSPAALLISRHPIEQDFEVRESTISAGTEWVELAPRVADAGFAKVRIGLADGRLQAMELVDGFGQLTQFRFSEVDDDPQLAASLFEFEPPAGSDVIGEQ